MFCPLPRDGGDPDFRVSPSFCFVALLLFHNVGLLEAKSPGKAEDQFSSCKEVHYLDPGKAVRRTESCGSAEKPHLRRTPCRGRQETMDEEPFHEYVVEQCKPCAWRGPRLGNGRDAPPAECRCKGGDALGRIGWCCKAEKKVR